MLLKHESLVPSAIESAPAHDFGNPYGTADPVDAPARILLAVTSTSHRLLTAEDFLPIGEVCLA